MLPPGEWDPHIRLEPPPQVPSQTDRMVSVNKDKEEGVVPPKASVECSKIPCRGLYLDAKRRYSHYLTDFKDAFWDTTANKCSVLSLLTTIASIVFIYFANIAPAITFGLVLSEKTGHLLVSVYKGLFKGYTRECYVGNKMATSYIVLHCHFPTH